MAYRINESRRERVYLHPGDDSLAAAEYENRTIWIDEVPRQFANDSTRQWLYCLN